LLSASIASADEGDEHGVFAPDVIRQRAEDRAAQAVEQIIQREGKDQGGAGEAKKGDRAFRDSKCIRDRSELRGGHQAARTDQNERDIHHPENRTGQHLARAEIDLGLHEARIQAPERSALGRFYENHGRDENDDALQQREMD
jgi:hypothetical protein